MANPQPTRFRSPIVWVLFSLAGRISRPIYWMCFVLFVSLEAALVAQIMGGEEASYYGPVSTILPVVLVVTMYSNIAVAVKRLHDVDYNGLLALALLIPFVNLAFTIWVGILPGTAGPNRYGAVVDIPPG